MAYAWLVNKSDGTTSGSLQDIAITDFPNHDISLKIHYSSLNYKDALAVTQKAPILKSLPGVPGIDLCGEVISSKSSDYNTGDILVATGWGLGESHWGGFAEFATIKSDWAQKLPQGMSPFQAMQVGTAGLTAMLCVMALEDKGLTPDQGEVLVTGASGGVGIFAIALLSKLGYRVIASSGKFQELESELRGLGAAEVVDRLPESSKPLQSERWAGAIDPVGGKSLSTMLTQMQYGSVIATCGLAGGAQFNSSVYPFILRGVSLIGIDSVYCSQTLRTLAWERITDILDSSFWQQLNAPSISLMDLYEVSQDLLSGKRWGRTVVDCQKKLPRPIAFN